MIFSNDQTDAVLNTLGEEQAAAWARFYAQRATPKITLDQRAYPAFLLGMVAGSGMEIIVKGGRH
jgi:hypothetical protein